MATSEGFEVSVDTLKGRKHGSIVWKYFEYLKTKPGSVDKSKTLCSLCGKILTFVNNTTNMNYYLNNKHYNIVIKGRD